METIVTIIIWAALVQGLLLGIVFIFSKKHRSIANKLLGLFLISFVFTAISDLLPFDVIGEYRVDEYFSLPEVKMFIPILFFHFILEKVGRSANYMGFLKIHYFLGAFILSITLTNLGFHIFMDSSLSFYLSRNDIETMYMYQQYYSFLITLVILILSIKEIRKYHELVKNEYADMALLDINWLWQCVLAITPVILIWGAELLRIMIGGKGQSELTIATYLFIVIFIYFVSYKAFTRQTLFDSSSEGVNSAANFSHENQSSANSLDPDICAIICQEMEQRKSYLNQDLTLHNFAFEIQVSSRVISTCVNQNLKVNFNEWVNSYRVDKALEIIRTDAAHQLSIEGIGIEAGFKSRSAMYAAFKKKLGKSPGHFR